MCKHAAKKILFVIRYVPDRFKVTCRVRVAYLKE